MINKMVINEAKKRQDLFNADHPKLMPFLDMVKGRALNAGTIVELKVIDEDGKEYESNIRLTENDVETISLIDRLFTL